MEIRDLAEVPIGSKLKVTTDEGVYVGVVRTNSWKNTKISFQNTTLYKTNQFVGMLNFFYDEIKNYEVIKCGVGKLPMHKDLFMAAFQKKPNKPNYLRRIHEHNTQGQDPCHKPPEKIQKCDFSAVKIKLPNDHHIIDCVEEAENALGVLENQSVLAVAVEGTSFDGKGKLFWIQVASHRHVFLFDMLVLKHEVFDRGLREICKNPRIEKVVHGRQFMSCTFLHQYNCKLINVFDTQVADTFITKGNSGGNVASKVNSYPYVVMKYLDVSQKYDCHKKNCLNSMEKISLWRQRPLPESMVDMAVKNVIYLLELRSVLHKEEMKLFKFGVLDNLSILQDCVDECRKANGVPGVLSKYSINIPTTEKHVLQNKNDVIMKKSYEDDLEKSNQEVYLKENNKIRRNRDFTFEISKNSQTTSNSYANKEKKFNFPKHQQFTVNSASRNSSEGHHLEGQSILSKKFNPSPCSYQSLASSLSPSSAYRSVNNASKSLPINTSRNLNYSTDNVHSGIILTSSEQQSVKSNNTKHQQCMAKTVYRYPNERNRLPPSKPLILQKQFNYPCSHQSLTSNLSPSSEFPCEKNTGNFLPENTADCSDSKIMKNCCSNQRNINSSIVITSCEQQLVNSNISRYSNEKNCLLSSKPSILQKRLNSSYAHQNLTSSFSSSSAYSSVNKTNKSIPKTTSGGSDNSASNTNSEESGISMNDDHSSQLNDDFSTHLAGSEEESVNSNLFKHEQYVSKDTYEKNHIPPSKSLILKKLFKPSLSSPQNFNSSRLFSFAYFSVTNTNVPKITLDSSAVNTDSGENYNLSANIDNDNTKKQPFTRKSNWSLLSNILSKIPVL